MENEAKNTAVTAEPGAGQAPSPPVGTPPTSKIEFQKLAGKVTEFTFLVVFILYSVGFLTWQSYLSKYGVSVTGFLRAEYLSAAFCYLFVLVTLAGPPVVLYQHWRNSKDGKPKNASLDVLLGFWWLLVLRFTFVFFPRPGGIPDAATGVMIAFGVLVVLYLFGYIYFAIKHPTARITRLLKPSDFSTSAIQVILVGFLLFGTGLEKWFLFSTVFLFWIFSYLAGTTMRLPDAWAKSNLVVRLLLICLTCFIMISHIQYFGRSVFGLIPRQVGGGKPETAFLRLDQQHLDLVSALNLPITNSFGISNGFSGPIAVLLRSEGEIIFVDYDRLNSPATVTNISTNLVLKIVTNHMANAIVLNTNSTTTFATNVVKNSMKIQAKQIRTDFVEAAMFDP